MDFLRLTLLVLHGIVAVLLIGAVTHQAVALWLPARRPVRGWWHALGAVHPERYVRAVVVLYLATVTLGMVLYPSFRVDVRAAYLDAHRPWATGIFELKEHAVAVGLALLPAYALVWRGDGADARARRAFTTLLTLVAWWSFVVGHVVNDVRGL
jgi:hypothetical protein